MFATEKSKENVLFATEKSKGNVLSDTETSKDNVLFATEKSKENVLFDAEKSKENVLFVIVQLGPEFHRQTPKTDHNQVCYHMHWAGKFVFINIVGLFIYLAKEFEEDEFNVPLTLSVFRDKRKGVSLKHND